MLSFNSPKPIRGLDAFTAARHRAPWPRPLDVPPPDLQGTPFLFPSLDSMVTGDEKLTYLAPGILRTWTARGNLRGGAGGTAVAAVAGWGFGRGPPTSGSLRARGWDRLIRWGWDERPVGEIFLCFNPHIWGRGPNEHSVRVGLRAHFEEHGYVEVNSEMFAKYRRELQE